MDLKRHDVAGAYEQLGIARDPLIALVSGLTRNGVSYRGSLKRLTYGVDDIVDQTIVHLSLGGLPETLPSSKPLTLGHLMETGALSERLKNNILNNEPSFKELHLVNIGAFHYSKLIQGHNSGIRTIVQLMAIVEASKQTSEFALKRNGSASQLDIPSLNPVLGNWERLSSQEQDSAIGRLTRQLGNPEFMDRVMPLVDQLEAARNGLGLARPDDVAVTKPIQQ